MVPSVATYRAHNKVANSVGGHKGIICSSYFTIIPNTYPTCNVRLDWYQLDFVRLELIKSCLYFNLATKYRLQATSKPGNYDQVRQECLELGGTLLSKCLNKDVNGATYEK